MPREAGRHTIVTSSLRSRHSLALFVSFDRHTIMWSGGFGEGLLSMCVNLMCILVVDRCRDILLTFNSGALQKFRIFCG